MKKKLTKTISLIVFVMFLQLFITEVHAASGKVALTCIYEKYDNNTVVLNITNSGSISKSPSCNWHGEIRNWKKAEYRGFKGQDYYLNNHACPPYAVYNVEFALSPDDVILAESESNAKKIKSDIIDGHVIKLKEQVLGEDASEDVKDATKDNEDIKKLSLPKTCECKENYNGTNISVKFEVPKNYANPDRPTVKYGDSEDKETIQNWGKSVGGYNYIDDLAKNDKCPDYAVVIRGRGIGNIAYTLYLSDEEHLSKVMGNRGNSRYSLPCTQKNTSIPTSNSNSNSNKKSNNSNKSNYQDPDVNSNVVRTLSYDVSTYSCGSEYLTGIPVRIPKLGKFIMNFLQILIPIVLIIYGSLDLVKAVYASKEDEIKKGQQTFVKRLTGSIIIFFVFAIVKLVISVVSTNSSPIMECVDCILRDSDNCFEEE